MWQMSYTETLKCCKVLICVFCSVLEFNPSKEKVILVGLVFDVCTNRRLYENYGKTHDIVTDNHKRLKTVQCLLICLINIACLTVF